MFLGLQSGLSSGTPLYVITTAIWCMFNVWVYSIAATGRGMFDSIMILATYCFTNLFTGADMNFQQIQWVNDCSGRFGIVSCSPLSATLSIAPLEHPSLPSISCVILAAFQNPLGKSESWIATISPTLVVGRDWWCVLGIGVHYITLINIPSPNGSNSGWSLCWYYV